MAGKIFIEWMRGGHVYGTHAQTAVAASAQSEAAPDMGGVPGQALVHCLEGAVHVLGGADPTVTAETGPRLAAGEKAVLRIPKLGKVAVMEATVTAAVPYAFLGGTGNALLLAKALVYAGRCKLLLADLISGIAAGGADTYVQIFDAAATADVTLGTTVPKLSLKVPPGGGFEKSYGTIGGLDFALGIVMAATTTATGAVASGTGVSGDVTYRAV